MRVSGVSWFRRTGAETGCRPERPFAAQDDHVVADRERPLPRGRTDVDVVHDDLDDLLLLLGHAKAPGLHERVEVHVDGDGRLPRDVDSRLEGGEPLLVDAYAVAPGRDAERRRQRQDPASTPVDDHIRARLAAAEGDGADRALENRRSRSLRSPGLRGRDRETRAQGRPTCRAPRRSALPSGGRWPRPSSRRGWRRGCARSGTRRGRRSIHHGRSARALLRSACALRPSLPPPAGATTPVGKARVARRRAPGRA